MAQCMESYARDQHVENLGCCCAVQYVSIQTFFFFLLWQFVHLKIAKNWATNSVLLLPVDVSFTPRWYTQLLELYIFVCLYLCTRDDCIHIHTYFAVNILYWGRKTSFNGRRCKNLWPNAVGQLVAFHKDGGRCWSSLFLSLGRCCCLSYLFCPSEVVRRQSCFIGLQKSGCTWDGIFSCVTQLPPPPPPPRQGWRERWELCVEITFISLRCGKVHLRARRAVSWFTVHLVANWKNHQIVISFQNFNCWII